VQGALRCVSSSQRIRSCGRRRCCCYLLPIDLLALTVTFSSQLSAVLFDDHHSYTCMSRTLTWVTCISA